jgi:SAM-dependent methyltransferase
MVDDTRSGVSSVNTEALEAIVAELVTKPRHEKVRGHLLRLLTDGLGADATSIDFERPLPEVRGRVDALLGRTVFEIKSDLIRERNDAERQLGSYLPQREAETGQRFVGIATDGAEFRVYMVRDGRLDELGQFKPKVNEPRALLAWLESVVALSDEIPPDVISIQRELGRHSIAYHRAIREIGALWNDLKDDPEANLKRDLWNRLLRVAYGTDIEAPALFFQHTYLTIVAKAIATVALLDTLPGSGATLLEGKDFRDLGIVGAVESDFFDWVLLHPRGGDLVMEIARQANRFRLRDIQVDILKGLYESLIDPEQRHDLGEYYTPDWLAERICEVAIRDPLNERVIDPACGSGTFLFHAIRRLLAAAQAAGISPAEAITRAEEKVTGIDVHPVAVIFARATYLLALMPTLQQDRPDSLSVPVYLGDALQWNAREFMNLHDLEIIVPAPGEAVRAEGGTISVEDSGERVVLRFPMNLAREPGLFNETLEEMLSLAGREQSIDSLTAWLARRGIADGPDLRMLCETYGAFRALQAQGRNHIWGYVARNLSRPIWLATEQQKADVVIGNPPWLDYRAMNPAVQRRFREEMKAAGLWAAKTHGAAFDLSAYFFARAVHLYMRQSGRIAFVMPYAAMTRKAYEPFRRGAFKAHGHIGAQVRFTDAWAFPQPDVEPLFKVPSCVLFAERSPLARPLPRQVQFFSGHLPRRDARPEEAAAALTGRSGPWPADEGLGGSPYRKSFRAGAKLDPRRLVLVEPVQAGRLGSNPSVPLVRGRTGSLDKKPWKEVPPPQAPVEAEFLRPIYLGESIAPYRLLRPVLGVIPWDEQSRELLTSDKASRRGYSRLSSWLATAERLWHEHGKGRTSFAEKIDYYHLLSTQFPIRGPRIVYSKAGINAAAAVVRDDRAIIDHMLYWARVESEGEGQYLTVIFNSEATRARVERYQAMGQWGARHFDKVMFNLPIPKFDSNIKLHRDLAVVAERAEKVAAAVPLKEGEHFTRARKRIRDALRADGVADELDKLVERLLSDKPQQIAA